MGRLAHKYNLSSLRLDANNAIKDCSASFLVFFTVLLSSLGFHYMDAIGCIAVGIFIITVSYVVLKQASLALLDTYQNTELAEDIQKIVEANGVTVNHILLRAAGPYTHAEIHLGRQLHYHSSTISNQRLRKLFSEKKDHRHTKNHYYSDPDRHLRYLFFYLTTSFLRLAGTCINHQWCRDCSHRRRPRP